MKRILTVVALTLALGACVDTTGISKESSKGPRGNVNSAVVVTEFADLQCPACRAASTLINQPLLAKYGTQVRFEYKNFPLRTLHRYAMDLAEAAECSADQGKFWEFTDLAFADQLEMDKEGTSVSPANITAWAKKLNLDMDLFTRCTTSHIKKGTVLADYDEGVKLGVNGTPTYFVNGKQLTSDPSVISAAIDAALQGAIQRL